MNPSRKIHEVGTTRRTQITYPVPTSIQVKICNMLKASFVPPLFTTASHEEPYRAGFTFQSSLTSLQNIVNKHERVSLRCTPHDQSSHVPVRPAYARGHCWNQHDKQTAARWLETAQEKQKCECYCCSSCCSKQHQRQTRKSTRFVNNYVHRCVFVRLSTNFRRGSSS